MVPLTKTIEVRYAVTTHIRRTSLPSGFLLLALTAALAAHAAPPAPEHWVGTWAAAPMAANNGPMAARVAAPPAVAPPSNSPSPLPPSAQAPTPPAAPMATAPYGRQPVYIYGSEDVTLREIVHVSIGGPQVRVVFTNEFGTDPLTIGSAHVAVSQGASAINLVAASSAGLTFGGRTSVTIPPGALIISDPASVTLPAESDLAVSFFLPEQPIHQISQHGSADQTSYRTTGNAVGAKTFDTPSEIRSWVFLKSVDVLAPARAAAVVAFGDSITDGAFAAINQNARWPDELGRRLIADKRTPDIAVLNLGIGGNRILHDNAGPSALARFDRDVIDQAGVKYVIILEAINDIGHAYDPVHAYDVVTADDLITGYKQMIARAHMHGIKVYMATLTPYTGAKYASPGGEEVRVALNRWIRTTHDADGVIDFEKVAADPAHPDTFLPAYDHSDHLHPSDPGYKAMGDAIDLSLFTK
jgi:lysophospholipase L1-like esterase